MPTAWRVTKAKHARHGFSGLGAHLYGGRWNSKSRGVVYTSSSLALAVLEILVHLPRPRYLRGHRAAPVELPGDLVDSVGRLPRGWRRNIRITQRIGDEWLRSESSPVLEVPSTMYRCGDEQPWNYLIDPNHASFPKLTLGAFRALEVDSRIPWSR